MSIDEIENDLHQPWQQDPKPQGDCINRQAAIDAACDGADECYGGRDEWRDKFITEFIEAVPSVQPEIIRCKDCLMHGVCRFEQGLGLDGYCSQAERRE